MAAAMWRYELEPGRAYAKTLDIDPKDDERIRAVIIAALGAVYSGGVFSIDHRRRANSDPEPERAYAWAHGALRELTTLPGQPSKQVLDAFAQVYLHSPHEHERAQGLAMSLEAFDAGRITSHAWLARLATHPELAADSKVAVKKKCLEVLGGDHPWCSTGVVDTTKPTKNYRGSCNMVID